MNMKYNILRGGHWLYYLLCLTLPYSLYPCGVFAKSVNKHFKLRQKSCNDKGKFLDFSLNKNIEWKLLHAHFKKAGTEQSRCCYMPHFHQPVYAALMFSCV